LLTRFSRAGKGLTTILFHRFFFPEETKDMSRDRLKRQCEWLSRNFNAISLDEARNGLMSDALPSHPLLITIDDAKIEILSVLDIFEAFALPISVFVCVGWSAQETPDRLCPKLTLAKLVADIEWHEGQPTSLRVAGEDYPVGGTKEQTRNVIDQILGRFWGSESKLEPLAKCAVQSRRPGVSCSFEELSSISSPTVSIGGHSVSHINIASASRLRCNYEVSTTREILLEKIGHCEAFAYPYGMKGTFSDETSREVARAGFEIAFLTHSEWSNNNTHRFEVPRISMPDRPMSQLEFCTRAAGAGVLYRRIKQHFR
jgi:peptidoglycan/xylan/chitin deacetylase (PgdA/CDA1 family)